MSVMSITMPTNTDCLKAVWQLRETAATCSPTFGNWHAIFDTALVLAGNIHLDECMACHTDQEAISFK